MYFVVVLVYMLGFVWVLTGYDSFIHEDGGEFWTFLVIGLLWPLFLFVFITIAVAGEVNDKVNRRWKR